MGKRNFTAEYKASLVVEMLREEQHISEIAAREGISRTQLQNWKKEFLEKAPEVFSGSKSAKEAARKEQEAAKREASMLKTICFICLDLAQRIVPIFLDEQRIDLTDKNPGVMEQLGHRLIVPPRVLQYHPCFTPRLFSRLASSLSSLEVWRTSKGFATSSPKGRITDTITFPFGNINSDCVHNLRSHHRFTIGEPSFALALSDGPLLPTHWFRCLRKPVLLPFSWFRLMNE